MLRRNLVLAMVVILGGATFVTSQPTRGRLWSALTTLGDRVTAL